jgi:hypothetical protein
MTNGHVGKHFYPKRFTPTNLLQDSNDVFITTTMEAKGLHPPTRLPPPQSIVSLMGVIKFLNVENLLTSSHFLLSCFL